MEYSSFIGIDISKLTIDVSHLDDEGELIGIKEFTNNMSGFNGMLQWLKINQLEGKPLFCLEHTGIYCLPICVFLEQNYLHYSIQSGLQIKRSMGIQRGKNDRADAKIIAKYAFLNRKEITISKLPSKAILKLKQLISYRDRLVKTKVALTTASKELKSFSDKELHKHIYDDSQIHIEQVNASISQVDKLLKEVIASDLELKRLFDLVNSVKGVGLQIAINLLISTHGFTRFKNWRKFSCYCGLAPFEYSSGSSIRGRTRVSHLGNRKVKAVIGNGIASAIQHDPEIAAYYSRKLKEGKHKMVVLNAIKNKLIARVFAVVKRGSPFVPLYQHA
jgi:transposase